MSESNQKKPGFFSRAARALAGALKTYFIMVGISATLAPLIIAATFYFFSKQISSLTDSGASDSKSLLGLSMSKGDRVLELKLDGTLSDKGARPGFGLSAFFSKQRSMSIQDARTVLRRAAKDPQIKGIFIDLIALSGENILRQELRRLLEEFKVSQKPIFAFVGDLETSDYYLLSVANKLGLASGAGVSLLGPEFQLLYFSEALSKLGIEFEVIKAGKYKSAFEPFINQSPSEASIEMYQSLEKSNRAHLVEVVSGSRGVDPQLVSQWFKQSLYTNQQAIDAKIVDFVGSKADFVESFKKELSVSASENWFDYSSHSTALDKDVISGDSRSKIGFIHASGEIHMSSGGSDSDVIAPDDLIKQLRWAKEDESIKAVVLRVDSPGGSATASEIIHDEVKRLAADKPVIVSMGQYAASGGYYISAPASKILAESGTITGSIGVIGALPKAPGLKEKWGVNVYIVSESDRIKLMHPMEKSSASDKASIEQSIAQVYEIFLTRVSEGRKIPLDKVRALAEGRVYTGDEALELGLVDEIGGLTEAFQAAKEAAGLDPKKLYGVEEYKGEESSLIECLNNPFQKKCIELLNSGSTRIESNLKDRSTVLISKLERFKSSLGKVSILAMWDGYYGAM